MQEITQQLVAVVQGAWRVAAEMSPYLLFGFALAGVLSVALSPAWVARHLGGRGWRPPVKAALFGVPLPLCSCGVIPVSASLRRGGASRGAVAAFLMSTPQTGVDSIAVTYGLLGPVFAIFRPLAAFVSGALCGMLVDRLQPTGMEGEPTPVPAGAAAASPVPAPARPVWLRALRHAFVVLPGDIHRTMLVGLLLAGVLGAWVPPDYLASQLGRGIGPMLAMLLLGIPMYVCSTASVPIALGLMQAGVSAGAAMVFLIAGPATNAAALTTMVRLLGVRGALVYLACLVATALGSGLLLDHWLMPRFAAADPMHACADPMTWSGHAAALVLAGLLVAPFFRRRQPRPPAQTAPAQA